MELGITAILVIVTSAVFSSLLCGNHGAMQHDTNSNLVVLKYV